MRKIIAVGLAIVLLLTVAVTPALAKKPGTDFNGPHYNLNLIGKDKEMPGDYDNPDRHTMFVPLDTTGMTIDLEEPYNLEKETLPGIKIEMTQGEEFAMIDGNATDGYGAFEIGAGKYHVYIAVKAKSPKYEDPYTNITGWVEAYDNLGQLWYYLDVGDVQIKKGKNSWTDATELFFVDTIEDAFGYLNWLEVEDMWVFDYMAGLDTWYEDMAAIGEEGAYDLSDLAYFWQFDNHGNKMIQIRFYPM